MAEPDLLCAMEAVLEGRDADAFLLGEEAIARIFGLAASHVAAGLLGLIQSDGEWAANAVTAASVAVALQAADPITFGFVRVSNKSSSDVAGQLSVSLLLTSGGDVLFVFSNVGDLDSTIQTALGPAVGLGLHRRRRTPRV